VDNNGFEQKKILQELYVLERKIKEGNLSEESAYILFTFLNKSCNLDEIKKMVEKVQSSWWVLEIKKKEFVFAHSLLRLIGELDQYKYIDFLTSLYNRRFFEETLARELARVAKYNFPLALFILDIDDFKKINDTYGHKTGDLVLQNVAKAIKKSLRMQDYACRIGGEEFGVILPQMSYKEAYKVGQRILLAVEELKIKIDQHVLQVTISGGGVVYAGVGSIEKDVLFKIADDNLYKAKRNGKNQFYLTSYYLQEDLQEVAVNQEEKRILFSD